MQVTFTKLDGRHYRIDAVSAKHHWQLPSAPGYDEDMPHDLAHFLAERETGIRLGIFGQLAAGGSAGTFRDGPASAAQTRTNDRLGRAGHSDVAASERLAAAVRGWWSRRTGRAETMTLPVELVTDRLAAVVVETAARWSGLEAGQALVLDWPETLTVADTNGAAGRRVNRRGRSRRR